ncbi:MULTISPECIES: hypothetical protein [Halococcus]|uniref:hypothetical protein n=1 Tax=Halococcus TaxID=2249 RepID=UPI000E742C78|nr:MULTISPECIES: hypothetical protein [Halococcus]RJT02083.1 hypothetical protein D3261_13890 [Halococcus sp. IIIV-5B]
MRPLDGSGTDDRRSVREWITCPYCENRDVDIEIWNAEQVVFDCEQCNSTATFSVGE